MYLVQAIKYNWNQHLHVEINASSARNKIGLEITIYTEINAFGSSNQIGLEIIYIETNASSTHNQI